MYYEWAWEKGKWDFNLTIATTYLGIGFYFTKGDCRNTLQIGLLCFHFMIMKTREGHSWNF